jgi:hypothetical protein
MRHKNGWYYSILIVGFAGFWSIPVNACLSISTDSFSSVYAQGLTLHWDSVCSTASLTYSQIDDDPAFLSPLDQATIGPPAIFGVPPLIPNTLYYAQVATNSFMLRSVALGSTTTLAEPPGVPGTPFVNVTESGFRVVWTSGTTQWNPPDTTYEVQIATEPTFGGSLITRSTTALQSDVVGLLEGTTYFAHVRAINRDLIATAYVLLGSTTTGVTPFTAGGSSTTIQSPDGAVTVTVASGTFDEDYRLFLTTDPVTSPVGPPETPARISEAEEKLAGNGEASRIPLPQNLTEIRAENTLGAPLNSQGVNPVTVTFVYPSIDGDVVNTGGMSVVRAKTLSIYRLNEEKSLWVRLPTSQVNTGARTVTATAPGLGVFSLEGQLDTSLETAYAYPVPFLEKRGDTSITFSDLAQRATIRIFTVSGNWVQTLEETDGDGALVWDVRDADGDPLPSGVYFYLLESSDDKKRGKLIIVRGSHAP